MGFFFRSEISESYLPKEIVMERQILIFHEYGEIELKFYSDNGLNGLLNFSTLSKISQQNRIEVCK